MPRTIVTRVSGALLLVAISAAFVDCGGRRPIGSSPAAGYNVLVVLADALRADHLGTYGYPRDTSPFIDSLAAEAVVFDHAVTPSTFTAQALTSIFSGVSPSMNASPGWLSAPRADRKTLAELFLDAGYRTAFISPTPVLATPGFKAGFEVVNQPADLKDPELSARLADAAMEFISEPHERPFLAYVHFFDPHEPYAPKPSWFREVGGGGKLPSDQPITKEQAFALSKRHFGPGDPAYEDLVLKYDAEIRDVDRNFQRLYAHLEELGLAETTLVVFLSDHGDEFWEHGYLDHAWTLYQETLHVPLIVRAPGVLEPERRRDRVSTMDLYATLAGLIGLDGEPSADSANLFAPDYDRSKPRPLLSELLLDDRNLVRTVTLGDWKLHSWVKYVPPRRRYPPAVTRWNRFLEERGRRLDPWTPVMKEELFHLGWDSGEQVNVISRFPAVAAELRSLLDERRRRALEDAPREAPSVDASERLEKLRSLGYIQGAADADVGGESSGSLFRIPLYEPGKVLAIGTDEADPYLAYGWSIPEGALRWTDGDEAMLWFRLESPDDMTLRIAGTTYAGQAVRLLVNGRRVATLWPTVDEHRVRLSGDLLAETNRIVFKAPKSTSPHRSAGLDDGRELGFAARSIALIPSEGRGAKNRLD